MNRRSRPNRNRYVCLERKLLCVFLVLLVTFVIVAGVTYAWGRYTDSVKNSFFSAQDQFTVQIDETFTPPTAVTPGQHVEKRVTVVNTAGLPAVVRVMVFPSIIGAENTMLEANLHQQIKLTHALDTENWMDGNDGYFYYLHILQPGEAAPPLLQGVQIDRDLGDAYQNAHLQIFVKSEASNIRKWSYRDSWWNGATPSSDPLRTVDQTLAALLDAV